MRIISRYFFIGLAFICAVTCGVDKSERKFQKASPPLNQNFLNPHTQEYVDILKRAGFYTTNDRDQKVIASTRMLAFEGQDFEEQEQKSNGLSIITYFYWSKNIAYQFGVKYRSDGLMELAALQIHYMDPATGKIAETDKIK